jgi:hypothetical protein
MYRCVCFGCYHLRAELLKRKWLKAVLKERKTEADNNVMAMRIRRKCSDSESEHQNALACVRRGDAGVVTDTRASGALPCVMLNCSNTVRVGSFFIL